MAYGSFHDVHIFWKRITLPDGTFTLSEEAFGKTVDYGPMPESALELLIVQRTRFFSRYALSIGSDFKAHRSDAKLEDAVH